MSVRQATRADVDAIRRVAKRSWETDYPETVLTRETVEEAVTDWYAPDRIETELEQERTLLLVAEHEGTVVGFAHATWSDDAEEGYILRIYVHPDHRRERVGRALLESTCTRLVDRGVDRINAMVLSENGPGIAFYERFGFEFVDESETGIGDETYPESRYALDPADRFG
jgi:ribosomal protein S18 acetylase RimI-like enzyme